MPHSLVFIAEQRGRHFRNLSNDIENWIGRNLRRARETCWQKSFNVFEDIAKVARLLLALMRRRHTMLMSRPNLKVRRGNNRRINYAKCSGKGLSLSAALFIKLSWECPGKGPSFSSCQWKSKFNSSSFSSFCIRILDFVSGTRRGKVWVWKQTITTYTFWSIVWLWKSQRENS